MVLCFVLKVSDCARQIKIAVDAPICDDASRFFDALDFHLVFRLVVEAERYSFTCLAHDSARVACVCHEYLLLIVVDNNHVCSAPDRIQRQIPFSSASVRLSFCKDLKQWRLIRRISLLHLSNFLQPTCHQLFVYFQEAESESLKVVFTLKLFGLAKNVKKVLLAILGYLSATVAVEHTEHALAAFEV
jgi:hypothetical protein